MDMLRFTEIFFKDFLTHFKYIRDKKYVKASLSLKQQWNVIVM